MSVVDASVVAAYLGTLLLLAIYGCHRSYLLYLFQRRRTLPAPPVGRLDPLPRVTVQLPIYNERFVVERVIESACGLDYPPSLLEIQVLDDSSDDTSSIAARAVALMRRRGHDIVHIRRARRDGFKAGALAAGLVRARGDLVAIFDADFVPGPGFLRDLVHHFSRPQVGMVQARWDHLNREGSMLTRIQSILLDGHFAIEHAARHRAGLFFNFNGTAGIWRRACIESAGGWLSDTLTEDLDLSYRAQLLGWKFVFAPEVTAPAELPSDIEAVKSQQQRWTRGSIETARVILPRLLRSRLPVAVKIEGLFHLTGGAAYLLMILLALMTVPAMIVRHATGLDVLLLVDLPLFLMTTASVVTFYAFSQREARGRWISSLASLPLMMAFGIGLSLNNALAVLSAFSGRRSEFVRTPKHNLMGRTRAPREHPYRIPSRPFLIGGELLFGLLFTGASAFALGQRWYASLPYLLLFQAGFLYIAFHSLLQAARKGRRAPSKEAGRRRAKKRLDAGAPASYMTPSKSS